jgi:hypothetical protein
MNKKTRTLLALAVLAFVSSGLFKFAFPEPQIDLSDFSIGLAVAFLLGTLFTWTRKSEFKT